MTLDISHRRNTSYCSMSNIYFKNIDIKQFVLYYTFYANMVIYIGDAGPFIYCLGWNCETTKVKTDYMYLSTNIWIHIHDYMPQRDCVLYHENAILLTHYCHTVFSLVWKEIICTIIINFQCSQYRKCKFSVFSTLRTCTLPSKI